MLTLIHIVMKNINLIKRLLSTYAANTETSAFAERVALLIQSLPEMDRENALAIITNDAELTMWPVDLVELTCDDKDYTIVGIQFAKPNFLQGIVTVRIKYAKTETHWYKTEEDAANGRNGRNYQAEEYTIAKPYRYESDTDIEFYLEEWNTGKVVWKR